MSVLRQEVAGPVLDAGQPDYVVEYQPYNLSGRSGGGVTGFVLGGGQSPIYSGLYFAGAHLTEVLHAW
ncbi:hypothetical protein AB0F91_41800 [Amycolatopsis sp. NPDC023774]|uniref:hypothetical protein n=1 Tax=Amycolatopsis sp. NPDC023774 TaxID=3155015 RepID=UPI0033FA88D5